MRDDERLLRLAVAQPVVRERGDERGQTLLTGLQHDQPDLARAIVLVLDLRQERLLDGVELEGERVARLRADFYETVAVEFEVVKQTLAQQPLGVT
uniref:hypothetical protein n=1 Tax=Methylobacterium sp. B34 TaxID=95563 RepID=UPI000FE14407|nr:hypothetical protein [Methylobacterium sp. B34]